jgi:glycosyltransferase involved in cell wall biosynthesis
MFLKEVWPKAKLGIYCEFYYQVHGADVDFDPEFLSHDIGAACRLRLKNLNTMLHFESADAGLSPTYWQANTFPEPFRKRITVIHDGIDTSKVVPNARVTMNLKTATGSVNLNKGDEVITFVNRNLEPYRGYHIFMRALPEILKRRPKARVLIVGGNKLSYGAPAPEGHTWKEIFVNEVRGRIADDDWERVHFLGNIAYEYFIPLLQLSTVHIYYTYPFVLSWSLLEAMSAGCAIVASNTQPLHEVIRHKENGLLIDFFDIEALVDNVCSLLDDPVERKRLGTYARDFVCSTYDLHTVCLPRQIEWVEEIAML